jgi:hypothetical protein
MDVLHATRRVADPIIQDEWSPPSGQNLNSASKDRWQQFDQNRAEEFPNALGSKFFRRNHSSNGSRNSTGVRGDICLTLKLARRPVVTRAAKKETQNRVIRLICPFLPPRVFAKCLPIRTMVGRGGGDRTRDPRPTSPVLVRFHLPKGRSRIKQTKTSKRFGNSQRERRGGWASWAIHGLFKKLTDCGDAS